MLFVRYFRRLMLEFGVPNSYLVAATPVRSALSLDPLPPLLVAGNR